MKIGQTKFNMELSSRELFLLTYAVKELMDITAEHDLKRGFGASEQAEMEDVEKVLVEAVNSCTKSLRK